MKTLFQRTSAARREDGFTAIETIVTLIVAVILVLSINTLFVTVIRNTASTRNRSNASTLAYSYLRQYAYFGATTEWFTCDSNSDLKQFPGAGGQDVVHGTVPSSTTDLPQPVTYAITAAAPYGCDSTNLTTPLLVRATITYGPDSLKVDHATYVARVE